MANLYTVHTKITPSVSVTVPQAEFDRLSELGLLDPPGGLDAVTVETDSIILGTSYPTGVPPGTVYVNTSVSP